VRTSSDISWHLYVGYDYWTGTLDESLQDAALVSLSFVRAHAPWLKERYGLVRDPRAQRPKDYGFMIADLASSYSGESIGAAVAGRPSHGYWLPSSFTSLDCSCVLWWLAVHMALWFTGREMPESVFITGTASISGT
jgi:hypothetical protein